MSEIVYTPVFLPNVTNDLIQTAMTRVAIEAQAQEGDTIEVKFLGITKDSRDGWPMKRWAIRMLY